jgi:hypothetical protein
MTKEFKVFYDGTAATQEQLDEIEEIVVEQEVGRVWEARIKVPVCVSDTGTWEGEEDPNRVEFKRVRVEARIGDGDFIPLIDGRVVGQDSQRSQAPGSSFITLLVHDDSALLHREAESVSFAGQSDSDIATTIFESAALGGKVDVEATPAQPDPSAVLNQHGTKMQMLRSLAARYQNYHAYVLPGEKAGASIGCFKKLPNVPDENIPPLYMFGEKRNLAEFNVRQSSHSASEITGASISFSDKSVATVNSSYRDATLLGDEVATNAPAGDVKKRRLPPGHNELTDIEGAAAGEADASGYTLRADGSVLPLRYTGILLPYKVVPVRLSDSRYSGNYLIFKVTHTLGRSEYTQSFNMRGNAVSPAKSAGPSVPAPSAAVSASFNVQFGVV